MNWKIQKSNNYNRVEFISSNLTLNAFINRDLKSYPLLLSSRSNNRGLNFEYEGLTIPDDLDDYDINTLGIIIPRGYIQVGNSLENEYTTILESVFDEILLNLSIELSKAHINNSKIGEDWRLKMLEGIDKLKKKIEKGYSLE